MGEWLLRAQGLNLSDWLQIAAFLQLLLILVVVLSMARNKSDVDLSPLVLRFDLMDKRQDRMEKILREELARNREELSNNSRQARAEGAAAMNAFSHSLQNRMAEISSLQKDQLDSFSKQLLMLTQTNEQKLERMRDTIEQHLSALQQENVRQLNRLREDMGSGARELRDEIGRSLDSFRDSLIRNMGDMGGLLKGQMESFSAQIQKLTGSNESRLESIRGTVALGLKQIQEENSRQLDRMRAIVDEKLQGTLEKRLGESFKQVSERLEQVHKGLGEMQTLASGVGDLKRTLTNVKTRGGWGEIQLEALLEEILAPEQFERNVKTGETGGEMVEFAIKLPGRDNGDGDPVWLPIDAKFPVEDYQRLMDAQEQADSDAVEMFSRMLVKRIKGCAKDIHDKYICPPRTTDFGIMFLPTEGLYAEVIRRAGLVDSIQREYRVVIAGPSTFAALLNSLQMGFRTLAIQKRSSEVWKLLGAVKAEFVKFGTALDGVRKKLQEATNRMDDAATRSRAIERKLRTVQELPPDEAQLLL